MQFTIVLLFVEALLGSGHRPSTAQGDGGNSLKASLHQDISVGSTPCHTEKKSARCCPNPVTKDTASTVEDCDCMCVAEQDHLAIELEKTKNFIKEYEDKGYPVDNTSDHPNYDAKQYVTNHINPNWFGPKRVLEGVDPPAPDAEVGSQSALWWDKFQNKGKLDVHDDTVPVQTKVTNAEHLLTNEGENKLEVDGESLPLIDKDTKEVSDKLKGHWRHLIDTLGKDAHDMKMMAEEELLALRDSLLKANVKSNAKISAAKNDLTARKEKYESDLKLREAAKNTQDASNDGHVD